MIESAESDDLPVSEFKILSSFFSLPSNIYSTLKNETGTEAYSTHRGQEHSQSIMFQRVISTITLQPYCTFFTPSIIQFLMEKHHKCRGDVAQTCLCGWDCLLRSFH